MSLIKHSGQPGAGLAFRAAQEICDGSRQKKQRLVHPASWLFYFFALIVFVLVIYFFPEIRHEFRLLHNVSKTWLALAVLLQLFSYFIAASVYRQLLKAENAVQVPSIMEMYKVAVILLFFNQSIPSAGISGNSFLFHHLRRKGVPAARLLTLILTELLTFYTAVLLVIICLLVYSKIAGLPATITGILVAGFLVYLLFSFAVLWMGNKNSLDFLEKRFGRMKLLQDFFKRQVREFKTGQLRDKSFNVISFIKCHPAAMLTACAMQLGLLTADVFTIAALFYGVNVNVSAIEICFAVIGSRIISVLPFSPGGLILYESSMVFFFVTFGLAVGTAVMVTLLFRLLSFWLPMPAGLLLYRKWLHR